MSDDQPTPIGAATPAISPETAPVAPADTDYKQRYDDLRPQYDRTMSRAQELERLHQGLQSGDPDAYAALGLQLADDTPTQDTTPDDPTLKLQERIDKIEQEFSTRQQQEREEQELAKVEQYIDSQASALALDDEDRAWIVARALSLEPNPDGLPDIAAAHKEFTDWETARQQKWKGTKRAPHVSPAGTAGTPTVDMNDPKARIAYMQERMSGGPTD